MLLSLFKPMSVAEKKKDNYKPYKQKLVICHPDLTQHKIFRTRGHICTAEKGKKLHVHEIGTLMPTTLFQLAISEFPQTSVSTRGYVLSL